MSILYSDSVGRWEWYIRSSGKLRAKATYDYESGYYQARWIIDTDGSSPLFTAESTGNRSSPPEVQLGFHSRRKLSTENPDTVRLSEMAFTYRWLGERLAFSWADLPDKGRSLLTGEEVAISYNPVESMVEITAQTASGRTEVIRIPETFDYMWLNTFGQVSTNAEDVAMPYLHWHEPENLNVSFTGSIDTA